MRLIPIILLVANLLVAASFLMDDPNAGRENEPSRRQIHPESIRIVGTDREVVAAPSAKSTEEVREPPLACATWGSFPESQVAAAESRLAPLELAARLSRTETAAASSYLVIIPPISRRADLNLRVDELKRAGVTDQFVISDGELRNGISLGFFKNEESANRHLADLKAKGVSDAVVSPKPSGNRTVTLHIRDLTERTSERLAEV
jgi:hypothetical protein